MAVTLSHFLDSAPVLRPSTCSPEGRPSPLLPGGPEFKAAAAQATVALRALLDQLHLRPKPPVRTAVALAPLDTALVLPPAVLHQGGSSPKEETQAWARWAEWAWGEGWGRAHHAPPCDSSVMHASPRVLVSLWLAPRRLHEALAEDEAVTALGKILYLLDGILDGQVGTPGGAGDGCGAGGGARDLPMVGGLSRGGMGVQNQVNVSVALCLGPFPGEPLESHEQSLGLSTKCSSAERGGWRLKMVLSTLFSEMGRFDLRVYRDSHRDRDQEKG